MNDRTRLRNLYWNMMERCYNSKHKSFRRYGHRGINVCNMWKGKKETFIKWALANGWQHGLILDRTNNNKGYSPSNCRFVTRKVSRANSAITQAVIDAARRKANDPVFRKKLSKAGKRSWQDPTRRTKQTKAMRKSWRDPGRKARGAAEMRRRWASPEYRARVSAAIRAALR